MEFDGVHQDAGTVAAADVELGGVWVAAFR
jgi:hypothetical protein